MTGQVQAATSAPNRRSRTPTDWIMVDARVDEHPKFLLLAQRLGINEVYAAAHVQKIWRWAIRPENQSTDGILRGQDPDAIESIAKWDGPPGALFDAMVDPEIRLVEFDVDSCEWKIRNRRVYRSSAELKAKERARKQAWRQKRVKACPGDIGSCPGDIDVVSLGHDEVSTDSADATAGPPAALKRIRPDELTPPTPPKGGAVQKRSARHGPGRSYAAHQRPRQRASPEVAALVEAFNRGAGKSGVQRADPPGPLTTARDRKLARLSARYGLEIFEAIGKALANSNHHRGKGTNKWTATLDWVIAKEETLQQWARAGLAELERGSAEASETPAPLPDTPPPASLPDPEESRLLLELVGSNYAMRGSTVCARKLSKLAQGGGQ